MVRSVLMVFALLLVSGRAAAEPPAGHWRGTLHTGASQLRLELVITGQAGALEGYLVSVDQGRAQIPAVIVWQDPGLTVSMAAIGARYEARREDGVLQGHYEQGGASFALVMRPGAFPAEPAAPADPLEEEVRLEGAAGPLAGTLKRPAGEGPFPALVLLSGSGSQDRDMTIAGQPVFTALAGALAEAGIASLRLDDRGVGGSDSPAPQSPHDLAADAGAALGWLRARPETAPACTGYAGHSEGAHIAFLAARDSDPAFILSLAGMAGTMEETLYEQAEALNRAAGASADQIAANRALQAEVFAVIAEGDPDSAGERIEAVLISRGLPPAAAAQQAQVWSQPYALAAFRIDPAVAIAAYEGPVAGIFAERDLQVLPEPNAARLEAARQVLPTRIETVAGVDHLFQENETGLPTAYGSAGHPLAPHAAEAIAAAAAGLVEQACTD